MRFNNNGIRQDLLRMYFPDCVISKLDSERSCDLGMQTVNKLTAEGKEKDRVKLCYKLMQEEQFL